MKTCTGSATTRPTATRATLATVATFITLAAPLSEPALAQTAAADGKALHIIVPFAPGGAQDVIGRYLGNKLTARLGVPVIIENKAGAGGVIAADFVAKAAPDGNTLLLATGGAISIAPHLNAKLQYEPRRDFAAVAMVADTPMTLAVRAQSPYASVADLLREAKTEVLLLAVPVNGHRTVMDALLPHLHGHTVIVSSMSSLSALYLHEAALALGRDMTVASFGTTVLTARRDGPARVRIMTRRAALGVSALPRSRTAAVLALCSQLFGDVFSAHDNALATALTNINPAAHGPLALFNWTRIERAENWPQYHHMTPRVAAVIERLDAERLALAGAFGVRVRTMEQHFAHSFGTGAARLADIAAELHAKRGGPPGPTDVQTRFLAEDVPYGLVFCVALGALASVEVKATRTIVDTASLISGQDFMSGNDLLEPLRLHGETRDGLLARVNRA